MLFRFDTENAEIFADQVSQIQDRETVLAWKRPWKMPRVCTTLSVYKATTNYWSNWTFPSSISSTGKPANHLDMLNLKESIENGTDTTNLLNVALARMCCSFYQGGEEELVLADQLKRTLCAKPAKPWPQLRPTRSEVC